MGSSAWHPRRRGYPTRQLPTSNSQLPRHFQRPTPNEPEPERKTPNVPNRSLGVGRWELPWELEVGSWEFFHSPLKVVPDPEMELALAEVAAAAGLREDQVLPLLVERRAPDVVDVEREAEEEALEA